MTRSRDARAGTLANFHQRTQLVALASRAAANDRVVATVAAMVPRTLGHAVALSREHLAGVEPRWTHVRAVGERAEVLCRDHRLPDELAAAAWLHDVGYGDQLVATGFHPLDGARFLRRIGVSELVASLVAYHSGAAFEAEERGLEAELHEFEHPPQDLLDVLVFVDMTTSPTGKRVSVDERLAGILNRYEAHDPVFRAVTRSGPMLRECASRGAARLGLADVGTLPIL
jgi:hypothetical protein